MSKIINTLKNSLLPPEKRNEVTAVCKKDEHAGYCSYDLHCPSCEMNVSYVEREPLFNRMYVYNFCPMCGAKISHRTFLYEGEEIEMVGEDV